ncbi:MAG: Hpt domain-containing protein [Candidatus Anammoxibacter sp.]
MVTTGRSNEYLQVTEADILSIEDNTEDIEILNNIFRCVHSIKGSAGFLVLKRFRN